MATKKTVAEQLAELEAEYTTRKTAIEREALGEQVNCLTDITRYEQGDDSMWVSDHGGWVEYDKVEILVQKLEARIPKEAVPAKPRKGGGAVRYEADADPYPRGHARRR